MAARRPTRRTPATASRPLPAYQPQLATLVADAPPEDAWLHEVKFDGYRMGLLIEPGTARLLTRSGLDWSSRFPDVLAAAHALPVRTAVLDGELAWQLPDGRTSFQALQNAGSQPGSLRYFVFDLLWLDDEDLAPQPLEARKARLETLLAKAPDPFRYSTHVVGHGARVHAEACRARLEGIIAKRRDAPATAGRSRTWVKVKCLGRQEFVVGGYTDPQGARQGIGALLIGQYEGDRLVWAGKVGTGFNTRSALALRTRLEPLARATSPFSPAPRGAAVRGAHWVEPTLVVEVAFTEWTSDGKVRHPSFQGVREDKPAREVRSEAQVEERRTQNAEHRTPNARERRPNAARRTQGNERSTQNAERRTKANGRMPKAGQRAPTPTRRSTAARVLVRGVSVSHPERVMYPDEGLTKLDLVRYVEAVGEWMLPHVAGRPLTLVFCPDGIAGECQYLKHGKTWGPHVLRRVKIREKTKVGEYMVADSVEGLVAIMQMNWIEVHTWNVTTTHLEQPDRLVIDLDPGPQVGWPDVVAAARETRDALQARGLASWVKTTGGRGLHVVAPLVPEAGWAEGLAFAESVAATLVQTSPRRYTTTFSKAGRERQILVDVMRNNRANTAVAAYSPRARAGAPVSTPLAWDELSTRRPPQRFTVQTVPRRLARLGADPWAAYWTCRQKIK